MRTIRVLAVPPAGRVGRWWPGRGANDQASNSTFNIQEARLANDQCPVRQRRHAHGGASNHELTSIVQLHRSRWLLYQRAGGDPGTTDSGSRLTSHDVMLPAARAPSRALCEAILPISQQRAALLPRSSRAVAGAVGEGRRGGRQRAERRGAVAGAVGEGRRGGRQRAERRGELCACREEG